MADLATQIGKARKAGYTDAQITAYLAKDQGIGAKVATARKAGYDDAAIVAHLSKPAKTSKNPLYYVGGEVAGAWISAWDKLKNDVVDDYRRSEADRKRGTGPESPMEFVKESADDVRRAGRLVANVGGLALSPITGLTEALVVKPGGAVLDQIPMDAYTSPKINVSRSGITTTPGRKMTDEERTEANRGTMRLAISAARPAGPKPVPTPKPASATAQTVAQFDRAGVTPSLAAVKGGAPAAFANAVAENPVGVLPRRRMAAQTREAGASAERIAAQYGQPTSQMTLGEDLQRSATAFSRGDGSRLPPDLARAKSSSKMTFGNKADALYTRAERLITTPDAPVDLANTSKALSEATAQFADPGLNGRFSNPVLKGIAKDVAAAGGKLSWRDAAALRSKIRTRLMSDPALRATTDDAAVNSIYGALTADLEAGANVLGGPAAGRAWKQANSFYRNGIARQEKALESVFGAKSGEQAYDRIVSAAGSGARADIRKISAVKRSLPPEQWGDLAATVIHRLGKPTAGAVNGADDAGFSVNTFLTNYAKLSPQGREVMFGSLGGGGAKATSLKAELDNLAEVVSSLKAVERGANASKSAVALQTGVMGGAALNPAFWPTLLKASAGMFTSGEIVTNPAVVRWLAKLGAAQKVSPAAVTAQSAALAKSARTVVGLQSLATQVQQALREPPTLAIPINGGGESSAQAPAEPSVGPTPAAGLGR